MPGSGGTVAIYKTTEVIGNSTTPVGTFYLHRDHLGSVVVITDDAGVAVDELSYDAHGRRRNNTDWVDYGASVTSPATTQRGFTGHEHLDHVGLIHMNGRVQDPILGRFLSADPFVQFPENLQSFNRYTYINNNPLSFTDPSGFMLGTTILAINSQYTQGAAFGSLYDFLFGSDFSVGGIDFGGFGFEFNGLQGTNITTIQQAQFSTNGLFAVGSAQEVNGNSVFIPGGRFGSLRGGGIFATGRGIYNEQPLFDIYAEGGEAPNPFDDDFLGLKCKGCSTFDKIV
ncbi:MAG: RHS repeat-associated core domain-containing protein [Candidatus Nitronauta litoralis]|uniref:RHS repeat-associated core domain-containing protein n=1 Tax=Candidatus Nitronauta litoralis TaxID=2705533 RepID=A0A7T0G024_9BACT|nr:MAG: RHS repeat-associated core domain-containing protein [Candidatus Nitronauta litoralis]